MASFKAQVRINQENKAGESNIKIRVDAQSYFTIIADDNNRKPICRLYLTSVKKYIGLLDEKKAEVRTEIISLDDIYKFSEQLLKIAASYS